MMCSQARRLDSFVQFRTFFQCATSWNLRESEARRWRQQQQQRYSHVFVFHSFPISSVNFIQFTEVYSACSSSTMPTKICRHFIVFRISMITGNPFPPRKHTSPIGSPGASRIASREAVDDIQGDAGNIIFSNSPKLNRPWSLCRFLGWQNFSTKTNGFLSYVRSRCHGAWIFIAEIHLVFLPYNLILSPRGQNMYNSLFRTCSHSNSGQVWRVLKDPYPKPVGEPIQNHSFGMSEDAGTTMSETLYHRYTRLDTSGQLASYQDWMDLRPF